MLVNGEQQHIAVDWASDRFWPIAAYADRQKYWVVLCRSCPQILLVKSDANDWTGRMQMGGQVRAITHLLPAAWQEVLRHQPQSTNPVRAGPATPHGTNSRG
jgi:hypothetical protein